MKIFNRLVVGVAATALLALTACSADEAETPPTTEPTTAAAPTTTEATTAAPPVDVAAAAEFCQMLDSKISIASINALPALANAQLALLPLNYPDSPAYLLDLVENLSDALSAWHDAQTDDEVTSAVSDAQTAINDITHECEAVGVLVLQ